MPILPLAALLIALALLAAASGVIAGEVRRRRMNRWLGSYLAQTPRRWSRPRSRETHLILCIADHYEPMRGGAPLDVARARVGRWVRDYPARLGGFRDSDGRPP